MGESPPLRPWPLSASEAVRRADELPFEPDLLEATKQEPSYSLCFLDLPEHRLHGVLSQAVSAPMPTSFESRSHRSAKRSCWRPGTRRAGRAVLPRGADPVAVAVQQQGRHHCRMKGRCARAVSPLSKIGERSSSSATSCPNVARRSTVRDQGRGTQTATPYFVAAAFAFRAATSPWRA